MLFNSIEFIYFFVIVVILFYLIEHKFRWGLLLVSSYFFYMCWNPVYIVLIIFSTLVDYALALFIEKQKKSLNKKLLLLLSLSANLGILFYFKYYNFIAVNIETIFSFFDLNVKIPKEDLLLPVGISFYTFQTLSYTFDVYFGNRKAEKHLGIFAVFVSFFPQLVAGPIEKSTQLLPQFFNKIKFDYNNIASGLRLMLWGFFKKVVIADRLAIYVDQIYSNPYDDSLNSIHLIIAGVFFAFQIYCDFSGYSDIAIGGARVLGYKLTLNFRAPYFSKSVTEIWTRWHISLMQWIREYLFMPLTMSLRYAGRYFMTYSIIITFVIVGIWHGANWTFILFGLIHGCILSIESFIRTNIRSNSIPIPQKIKSIGNVVYTFVIWVSTLIIFRSDSIQDSFEIFNRIFSLKMYNFSTNTLRTFVHLFPIKHIMVIGMSLSMLMIVEYLHVKNKFVPVFTKIPVIIRWICYLGICFITVIFAINNKGQFIYFQF